MYTSLTAAGYCSNVSLAMWRLLYTYLTQTTTAPELTQKCQNSIQLNSYIQLYTSTSYSLRTVLSQQLLTAC